MTRPDHTAVPPAGVIAAGRATYEAWREAALPGQPLWHQLPRAAQENWARREAAPQIKTWQERFNAMAPMFTRPGTPAADMTRQECMQKEIADLRAALAEGAAPTAAQAAWVSVADLPLPVARLYVQGRYRRASVLPGRGEPLFTADQMREYALAAIASHAPHATLAPQASPESATSGAASAVKVTLEAAVAACEGVRIHVEKWRPYSGEQEAHNTAVDECIGEIRALKGE